MTTTRINPLLPCIVALLFSSNLEYNVRGFSFSVPTVTKSTTRSYDLIRLCLSSEVVDSETPSRSSSSKSSIDTRKITTVKDKFVKPSRVVPQDLMLIPILYNYDHCPFCVRVRLALGFKNIKHNIVFLANDDVTTPTAMVGRKVAPIMVRTDSKIGRKETKKYLFSFVLSCVLNWIVIISFFL